MPSSVRQQTLLVAEDWKKVYQTFRQADFQSYDFETLRKSMIDYLKLYLYEDFNDFIESSEYIALIDLIAFLGQSIAFRVDLNARENFIDTAERRDSILKLARLISYSPKRNTAATGYLKVEAVSTTENVNDTSGNILSNQIINWNDPNNDNWQEQFNAIFNAAMASTQRVGKPAAQTTMGATRYQQYQLTLPNGTVPVYQFSATVQGIETIFEAVGTTIQDDVLRESNPSIRGVFDLLYKNDGRGAQSPHTGFFVKFVQGKLENQDFTIAESVSNRIFSINTSNINDTDVWLFDVDAAGASATMWKSVPTLAVSNVVYNSGANAMKKLYQITSRANDQIDLNFGDGNFSQIPVGTFRLYYRTSIGVGFKILPTDMVRVPIVIDYLSRNNKIETLSLAVSLTTTVTNASASETIEEIRQRAPQQYYVQNRMVNGEDYNLLPYTKFSNIVKSKAVNRTSSGISRYLDVIDATGKQSTTNVFGDDAIMYAENTVQSFTFDYATGLDILTMIGDRLNSVLRSRSMLQFYYAYYRRFSSPLVWQLSTVGTNQSTGFFRQYNRNQPDPIGPAYSSNIVKGTIVKFGAPQGLPQVPSKKYSEPTHFDLDNNLMLGPPNFTTGERLYLYATVMTVLDDGTNDGLGNLLDGTGPVSLNGKIPTDAEVIEFIPSWESSFSGEFTGIIVENILANKNFGITYDPSSRNWLTVPLLPPIDQPFNQVTNPWLVRFDYASGVYKVSYRSLKYLVESPSQTRFYFDPNVRIYDSKTGQVIADQIKILKSNSQPDNTLGFPQDQICYVYSPVTEVDGYIDSRRIEVTFSDSDGDGIADDPDFFETIVFSKISTNVNGLVSRSNPARDYIKTSLIFNKKDIDQYNYVRWLPINKGQVLIFDSKNKIESVKKQYVVGQLYYSSTEGVMYQSIKINNGIEIKDVSADYLIREGRQNLIFQYKHNSSQNRRIDPSPINIIDLYILTKQYDTDYRLWVQDNTGRVVKPSLPTPDELEASYSDLDNYKMISDSIIYNPAKYKPIFGPDADLSLQAIFKVVKASGSLASDAQIKSGLISAINTYFAIENWDFGESFYFTEMAAYLHQRLASLVSSIVIVPVQDSSKYGALQQINAEPDEILISTARVDDVVIIPALTAVQLNSVVSNI
jgi:hypothetical protein